MRFLILVILALLTLPIMAQEDTTTTTNTAPTILSISPEEAVVDGPGVVLVEVTYQDPDTDVIRFDWTMVETDMLFYQLPAGRFNQALAGETVIVPFTCNGTPYTAEISLEVVDAAGNRSAPASFTLRCEGESVTPAPTMPPPQDDTPNTPPRIVSINPVETTVEGDSTVTVEVTYEDPDENAVRFIWDMLETNAIQWELAEGEFIQAAVGTTIPVTLYCTTPTFEATIQLIVEDANGSQSLPATFDLICE